MRSTTAPIKNNTLLLLHSNRRATQESIAPLKLRIAPPLNRSCTPFQGFYQNYGSLPYLYCKKVSSIYMGSKSRCELHILFPNIISVVMSRNRLFSYTHLKVDGYAADNVVLIILINHYKERRSPAPFELGAGLRFCAVKIILIGSSKYFFLCPLF